MYPFCIFTHGILSSPTSEFVAILNLDLAITWAEPKVPFGSVSLTVCEVVEGFESHDKDVVAAVLVYS